jgi:DNA repair protein RecO (recombination protein O)
MKYKTRGIVFNYIKFRESSIIARIYTDHFGLKNYIVNSVRTSKPRYPISYFQPLTMLDLIVYNREFNEINRIAEIKCSYAYKSVPYNIIKSTVAVFVTELLYKTLREEETNPELYRFLEDSLLYFDRVENDFMNFHLQFLFKYARFHGIEPIRISDMVHEIESNNFLVSIPRRDFEKIDHLIESPYDSKIIISNDLRRRILTMIILFYQIHFDHLKDLKSFKVLMEVFGD